mgnify:CR=1 FL=1
MLGPVYTIEQLGIEEKLKIIFSNCIYLHELEVIQQLRGPNFDNVVHLTLPPLDRTIVDILCTTYPLFT